MGDPVPLSAPDGTVMAWACGECHAVTSRGAHASWWSTATRSRIQGEIAADSRAAAVLCCARCGCGQRGTWLCVDCARDGRRAFEALGAIGMAVAVHHYALDLHDCMTRPRGIDMCPATAALCGVSPETVRGWR